MKKSISKKQMVTTLQEVIEFRMWDSAYKCNKMNEAKKMGNAADAKKWCDSATNDFTTAYSLSMLFNHSKEEEDTDIDSFIWDALRMWRNRLRLIIKSWDGEENA